MSLLEASMLGRKRRVDYGMPFADWSTRALTANLQVLPMSPQVVVAEHRLPTTFNGDPADRIIAACAIAHRLTLLTPDRKVAFHRVCKTIRYAWPARRRRATTSREARPRIGQ
jgi:PIN domain nuclease of toxin-antitoxin system